MKMKGGWKDRKCESDVGSDEELRKDRLNIFVMHNSKERLATPLSKLNRPGNIPECCNLTVLYYS